MKSKIIPLGKSETPVNMDIPDKIDVESLLKDFKVTNIENFNVYLQQLSKDFFSQSDNPGLGINKITFLNYFQLPGIIGERLYSVFNTKQTDYLEVDEFINGMTKLYTGNFDSLSKFIFNLYDFDKDGVISKEDIRVVLSYIPLRRVKVENVKRVHKKEFNNVVESQEELNNIIEKSFIDPNNNEKTIQYMDYNRFFYVIQNISSEIVLYILIYLLKKRPFSKETLGLYDNIILKGILTPMLTNTNNTATTKIMVPSPSMKSKFSPSLAIKHSPYMKEKAKTTLLGSKGQNEFGKNSTAKNLLNKFAMNHSSENKTKTIQVTRKNNNLNKKASTNKPLSFSLSNGVGVGLGIGNSTKKVDDVDALTKLTRVKKKVNSISGNEANNMVKEDDDNIDEGVDVKAMKTVQMRRKYRCFLKGIQNDEPISPEEPTTPSTPGAEERDLTNAFKYNFTKMFQDQVIDEEEEELKEGEQEIKYEGFLYKVKRGNQLIQRFFKLIQKDLYTYEHLSDSNHKGLHNLSGVFVEENEQCVINGIKYFSFRLVFSKKIRYYYCNDESQYQAWLKNLRAVTGYSNLNELYTFKGKLGKGKFGTVKLAVRNTTGEEVAIKILKKETMTPKDLERAHTEIEIMKISKHPFIVKLKDVFENRVYIYIIMEYCKGGDMFSYLEKRNFKVDEHRAAHLTKQIMTALYYLHSFGIMHRDLKPENIMMSTEAENSDIRLVDFGLSNLIGPNEKCTESFGTLGYVAPEVLSEMPYDKSVDYWSLGIVAYLLITGCLPFDDENPKEIIRQTIYDPVPFPKYLWKNFSPESKNFVNSK